MAVLKYWLYDRLEINNFFICIRKKFNRAYSYSDILLNHNRIIGFSRIRAPANKITALSSKNSTISGAKGILSIEFRSIASGYCINLLYENVYFVIHRTLSDYLTETADVVLIRCAKPTIWYVTSIPHRKWLLSSLGSMSRSSGLRLLPACFIGPVVDVIVESPVVRRWVLTLL